MPRRWTPDDLPSEELKLREVWGRNIKVRMLERKVTGEDLASILGRDKGAVSRWLNGKSTPANLSTFAQLARALGWTVAELMRPLEGKGKL